ncbi:Imm51 family immunity protein [Achromobacter seleniivolatilans]|uniref:Imm51 family immunity protein n=1 Tax=Achromobacter seleniivolatilans TaxID=3047478 RepID=A0ABY9M4E0_9BURK|nr:Imm51 family immunity protein [Achromobacter sp. R39]WMD21877.1 Imm51 family immunity protein [Achromobacter sp. R39]
MDIDFEAAIKPFNWMEYEGSFSVTLTVGEYKVEVFRRRREEGFLGTGYDWVSLALVFLDEKMPELSDAIDFDPEADTFCAYSSDSESLKKFILGFKAACEDWRLIQDLFSRAELD